MDIFHSAIQLYVLLSPCLCSISFLYPDFYVLGEDTSIGYQTKHLFVLIRIRNKGEFGMVKHV